MFDAPIDMRDELFPQKYAVKSSAIVIRNKPCEFFVVKMLSQQPMTVFWVSV